MESRAASQNPEDIDALWEEGQSALASGDPGRAVSVLREACRLAPFRRDLREALAEALEKAMADGVDIAPAPARNAKQPPRERQTPKTAPAAPRFQPARPPRNPMFSDRRPIVVSEAAAPRAPSITPWIWFSVITLFSCIAAVGYVLYNVDVRELVNSVKMTPKDREISDLIKKSDTLIVQQRYDGAIGALDDALKLEPDNPSSIQKKKAEAYATQAEQVYRGERYEAAADLYQRATQCDPESSELYYELGSAHYFAAFTMKTPPGSAAKSSVKAKVDEHYGAAERAFKRAIQLDPANLRAYTSLANTYIRLNRVNDAIAQWIRVIELAPDSTEAGHVRRNLLIRHVDVDKILAERAKTLAAGESSGERPNP